VLGLLTQAPRSGYDLVRQVNASVGHIWSPARSHVYAVVGRLQRDGLVRSRHVAQNDRPNKQVHSPTRAGQAAFNAWLETTEPDLEAMLLRLFFAEAAPRATRVAMVETMRRRLESDLATYREIEQEIAEEDSSAYGYATLRYGLARAEAGVRWADETVRWLERS
jgi:DNA-binding PadR family transcriptional regulator